MSPQRAKENLDAVMAHLWMIRTFLKHAEEIQDDADMLEVPRMVFDYVRAVEPSSQSGDVARYLRLAKGKLPKLRRVAELFAKEYRRFSDHTNYQMASASLNACVRQIEEILTALNVTDEPVAETNS